MSKGINLLRIFIMLAFALLSSFSASAQVDDLVRRGDSLYRAYCFDAAVDVYSQALQQIEASARLDHNIQKSVSDRLQRAENGLKMSQFVRAPKVLGRKKCSKKDYFLYFSLEDKSWRELPTILDAAAGDEFVRALYAPDWDDVLYFSTDDGTGTRSIYMTENQEGMWSVPRKVDEVSSVGSNEIYPMVSPDKRTMYFSSDAPGGLGGYDLYYSRWDDLQESWSMPQNMGIPFSSPDDDFLFIDSEDEKYSMFASSRDCSPDSVWVYALEYDRDPGYYTMDNPKELYALSRLLSRKEATAVEEGVSDENDLLATYTSHMEAVRVLKDSVAFVTKQVDELRTEMAFSNDESKRYELSFQIQEKEKLLPILQDEYDLAQEELLKIEFEFLRKGVLSNQNGSGNTEENDEVFAQYEFVRRSFGAPLELEMAVPDESFDYSFRILKEAAFAEDQTLPAGIVYQIQLSGGGRKAVISELKGLSPVYEIRQPNGQYVYRVGCFATYEDASENIQTVLSLGFHRAYLCAFENGVDISVTKAKTLQDRLKGGFRLFEIFVTPDSGVLDSKAMDQIRAIAVGKEIINTARDGGKNVYKIGPFDTKEEADAVISAIERIVSGRIICESIN